MNFKQFFENAMKSPSNIMRPYYFPTNDASLSLMAGETYLQLRLERMYLKHKRVGFQSKYPVVHAQLGYKDRRGDVESNVVSKPRLVGGAGDDQLNNVVALTETLLGPIVYWGGDLDLILGLYAMTATDWADNFIVLAEGVSKLTLNPAVSVAADVAKTLKTSVENLFGSSHVQLQLGISQELRANAELQAGHIAIINAQTDQIDQKMLRVERNELTSANGGICQAYDYMLLSVDVFDHRKDWLTLGLADLWDEMIQSMAQNDVDDQKEAYRAFASAVMQANLTVKDRDRVCAYGRESMLAARNNLDTGFLEGIKGARGANETYFAVDEAMVATIEPIHSAGELFAADWLDL